MFPMEFDHKILGSLPLPDEERIGQVKELLKAILEHRVAYYFKTSRGTDPLKLARLREQLHLVRMEDERSQIEIVSAITHSEERSIIQIHERIFDYIAFVVPHDTEMRIGEGTVEEQKMLAFAEFFLRHEVDHLLYPERDEREIIDGDVDFAMQNYTEDPTYYRMLRNSLADEMNGIKGDLYLALFDRAEQGLPYDTVVTSILYRLVVALARTPGSFLHHVFPFLDRELKVRVLDEQLRRSRSDAASLLQRASSLQKVLRLFMLLIAKDEEDAFRVFSAFKDRWGVVQLFHELDLPETSADNKSPEELFELFKRTLEIYSEEDRALSLHLPATAVEPIEPKKVLEEPKKSLKDRIEDARNDLNVPRRVLEVIDKNKLNAVGHSGSKYSELIETLLAIPWGRVRKIGVSPEAFEQGLNLSHYGLEKPKEIVCDFFTNLIWRYRQYSETETASWRQTGSAFLFVGPPGVGKTSLAISIAQNLGIPYHKVSLGGMRDEADLRGHGFTYEGSKPGAIVQGLIKMEVMNGMFILDEADKTEKFAIAPLLEILDPEQNHLFHDKYTETTIDIDLSNCHFILTANALDGVPPVIANRCEVVLLDSYSVEEKVAIAQNYLITRLRKKYQISDRQIFFDPEMETDLLRYLIRTYTFEAGVRELERIIRTLFLRLQRKEIFSRGRASVRITRAVIKEYLKEPSRPRQINDDDQVGEMLGLGVDIERGAGSIIPIQATGIGGEASAEEGRRGYVSLIHATGNIEKIMDESRKVATTGIFHCAAELGIDLGRVYEPVHLHFMGASTRKDGPSAGGAIALALASLLSGRKIRRDVAMTGEIDTRGRISAVGGLAMKIETAHNAGCKTIIIPQENLYGEGGVERLPEALKKELQILTFAAWRQDHSPFDYLRHILEVVAVENITQAAAVAFVKDEELRGLEERFQDFSQLVRDRLAMEEGEPQRRVLIVHVKSVSDVDPNLFERSFCRGWSQLHLLANAQIGGAVLDKLQTAKELVKIHDFDHERHDLGEAVQKIIESSGDIAAMPVRVAVIAPFYYLLKYRTALQSLPNSLKIDGVDLYANNYTVQQAKIKNCKPVIARLICLLGQFEPAVLQSCPFLRKHEEIQVLDMAFIPEKYRLDIHRAELIINGCLQSWLDSFRA